jgi:hypothetical protein
LGFIAIWVFADDYGNHPAKPRMLGAEAFPYDNVSEEEMREVCDELLRQQLIVEYDGDDGLTYWHVRSWEHQRVHNPSAAKWPEFREGSCRATAGLQQGSRLLIGKVKGKVKGKGSNKKTCASAQAKEKPADAGRVCVWPSLEEVQEYFREKGTDVTPEEFFAYYEANGWRQANGNPIKNWRQCLVTWEARARERKLQNGKSIPEDFRA